MKWHSLLICFPLNLKYASSKCVLRCLRKWLNCSLFWADSERLHLLGCSEGWCLLCHPVYTQKSHEIGWPQTNIIGQPYEDRTRWHNKNILTDRPTELIQNYSHLPTSIVTYCITCDLHHWSMTCTLYTMNTHHNTQGVTKQPFLSVDNQKLFGVFIL